jgi:hypothetical protein
VGIWDTFRLHFLLPVRSISKPCTALLFLLVAALFFEGLELLFAQSLAASLGLQTATIVAVGSSINVEERGHLPLALVLIIVCFWSEAGLLELPCEPVEVCRSAVVMQRGTENASTSCGGSSFGFFFLLGCFLGIVCIGVVAPMNGGIIASPFALWWRAGAWCAGTCCQSSNAATRVSVTFTY